MFLYLVQRSTCQKYILNAYFLRPPLVAPSPRRAVVCNSAAAAVGALSQATHRFHVVGRIRVGFGTVRLLVRLLHADLDRNFRPNHAAGTSSDKENHGTQSYLLFEQSFHCPASPRIFRSVIIDTATSFQEKCENIISTHILPIIAVLSDVGYRISNQAPMLRRRRARLSRFKSYRHRQSHRSTNSRQCRSLSKQTRCSLTPILATVTTTICT